MSFLLGSVDIILYLCKEQIKQDIMTTVVLEFKAVDFKETNYTDSKDCAITRALHRAGYPMLRDCGSEICVDIFTDVTSFDNSDYEKLVDELVLPMYKFVANHKRYANDLVLEPRDFTYELELDLSVLEDESYTG